MEQSVTIYGKRFNHFIPESEILRAVEKVAAEIAEDYRDAVPVFVGVLNGAYMFVSDFMKHYPHPCELTFVKLSSYRGLTSTGIVENPCNLMSGNSIGVCALCATWRHAPRWGDPLFCYSMKATKPPWRLQNAARSRYRA